MAGGRMIKAFTKTFVQANQRLQNALPPDGEKARPSVAVVYGAMAGCGGLGHQAATVLSALADSHSLVHAFGPGWLPRWPLEGKTHGILWNTAPQPLPPWASRYTWLRWYQGQYQFLCDRRRGRWAAINLSRLRPRYCYVFTQVALETLQWARRAGVPTVLDSPTGHIRNFHQVYHQESCRWCRRAYRGHPSTAMVERVEQEYQMADRIRVSSAWAKASLAAFGVPAQKVYIVPQPLDLQRFHLCPAPGQVRGPLRICFVGSFDFRKGFLYLLQAIRRLGPGRVSLQMVGATGQRCCRKLLEREGAGLALTFAPGDPVPAYHWAEVMVFPTLEDGFGLVVAEAMACGLPVIATNQCGASEWLRPGRTGWVIPAGQVEPLAAALEEALRRRSELPSMGLQARADVEAQAGPACFSALPDWLYRTNEFHMVTESQAGGAAGGPQEKS